MLSWGDVFSDGCCSWFVSTFWDISWLFGISSVSLLFVVWLFSTVFTFSPYDTSSSFNTCSFSLSLSELSNTIGIIVSFSRLSAFTLSSCNAFGNSVSSCTTSAFSSLLSCSTTGEIISLYFCSISLYVSVNCKFGFCSTSFFKSSCNDFSFSNISWFDITVLFSSTEFIGFTSVWLFSSFLLLNTSSTIFPVCSCVVATE